MSIILRRVISGTLNVRGGTHMKQLLLILSIVSLILPMYGQDSHAARRRTPPPGQADVTRASTASSSDIAVDRVIRAHCAKGLETYELDDETDRFESYEGGRGYDGL